ncbi:MAG TPA: hypothetical protein VL337_12455 [Acidimicrobiales bacterium]|jgi:hypothetical protein|nr:hypothetical protein [Acidimicrobiales bacterium]
MVSDQDRRELYQALEQQLGGGPATTMMELLPPVGWADVARQSDLVAVRGEMAELRGEMAELRAELKGEMAELRGELKTILPKLVAANIASMIGVAGLVLAAAKLA